MCRHKTSLSIVMGVMISFKYYAGSVEEICDGCIGSFMSNLNEDISDKDSIEGNDK
jgi:hypothetical protein